MSSIVGWIVALAIALALVAVATIFFKAYRSGTSPSDVLFKPKPVPRIDVVEFATLDSKRKLVLIRRDDVEHLIMTGGPVDVVIETGIGHQAANAVSAQPHAAQQAAAHANVPHMNLVETARRAVEVQHFPQPPAAPVFSRPPRAFAPMPETPAVPSPPTAAQTVAEATEAAADLALKR
jgi:flagellar protein FliO/FliZ